MSFDHMVHQNQLKFITLKCGEGAELMRGIGLKEICEGITVLIFQSGPKSFISPFNFGKSQFITHIIDFPESISLSANFL